MNCKYTKFRLTVAIPKTIQLRENLTYAHKSAMIKPVFLA